MNKPIRDRWIDRLESGNIKQTNGVLGRKSGSRCCLGVLCDIAVEDGIIPAPTVNNETGILDYDGWGVDLPPEVMEWAELERSDPDWGKVIPKGTKNPPHHPFITLARLNDTSKYNFKKIAKVLREHF